ncbi:hypothetical protein BJX62DRAFT_233969 [Aspergillus germanicus]
MSPDPMTVEKGIGLLTFLLNVGDRLLPREDLQHLKGMRQSLADLVTQQGVHGTRQAALTAEQTKAVVGALSSLSMQQGATGRLVTSAINQQTQALAHEIFRQTTILEMETGMLGTFTEEQTKAIIAQTARQVEGFAGIASQMDKTNHMLKSIANELKVLSKPDLFNQIMGAGLPTDSIAWPITRILKTRAETNSPATSTDVRSMIEKHQEDKTPHYFFVFNQSTTWHPKFDDIKRADPLGEQFLGYYHDLDVLVDFIVSTARPRLGPEPVIHILIPTISQLAITESLTLPEGVGPLRVDGQLGESGLPMVYLCMPLAADRELVRNIGLLRPRRRWVLCQRVGICLPIIGRWLSTPLEPVFFEEPTYSVTISVGFPVYMAFYIETHPVPPRTLGMQRQ